MTEEEKNELFEIIEKIDDISTKMRSLHIRQMELLKRIGLYDEYYKHFFENVVMPMKAKWDKENKNDMQRLPIPPCLH